MNQKDIVPEQNQGVETNTESTIELNTQDEAKQFFLIVKERLFNVNQWHNVAGTVTASFQLTDDKGFTAIGRPKPGDHFKISIPAPGTITGEGNDWVRIEAIEEEENCAGIRVRPATNPTNDRTDVAHFFDNSATSSFIVRREGNKITAGIYGRNERPNTDTEKVLDKIRNAAIATGAISGFSKLQWKSLVNGLINKD